MGKKLIEVALPLEAINAESAREKSLRHGLPSTLHLWWARRPLASARAVIWASLVDDPSSRPDLFPTEEMQKKERERLFGILAHLVKWENSNNPDVLAEAKAEISKATGGKTLALLDPFAGGGAIPLEAQRLGLEAHAHDLNPVAVLINKAMIEIPPIFANHQPVNPEARATISGNSWIGAAGLAEDVRYYGQWIKQKAIERIGHLYPKVAIPGTKSKTNVVAWIWTRTIKCPNPACGCTIPCTSSYELCKIKGHCAWLEPVQDGDHFKFIVRTGSKVPVLPETKKNRGAAFVCPSCGETTLDAYVKEEGKAGRIGNQLVALVAEGVNGKFFLEADDEQVRASEVQKPEEYPDGEMPQNPRWFSPPAFGMNKYSDLMTNRQLFTITTLSSIILEAEKEVEKDAIKNGVFDDHISLDQGGKGAKAYSEAIRVYLSFLIDKVVERSSTLCRWDTGRNTIGNTHGRQALPMVWMFAESNPLGTLSGSIDSLLGNIVECIRNLPASQVSIVRQFDAQSDSGLRDVVVSTDPPYYDNIGYADLSDYFYIWLRYNLKEVYHHLFRTMLVPKSEELIATPYRFNGDMQAAKEYFEQGMVEACKRLNDYASSDYPVTIYYAFKQNDNEDSLSGWETMLSALIQAGFSIVGTWPMRTELTSALKGNINALASSIVLVCRKRPSDAADITRRDFINVLHREMRPALEALQFSNIAPVDLAQSAIGPGIGVYSRYKNVIEADGSRMSVRSALQIINQELDTFYNEQEGELDAKSRFCVDIFSQYAFNALKFGDADILARAKNTSVQTLVDECVMEAAKGSVCLKTRDEIPMVIDQNEDCCWKITQQLTRAFEQGGVKECAAAVVNLKGYIAENAKALAYRLYTICERKNWAAEGYAYNNLIVAWPDIQSEAAKLQIETPVQMNMFDGV